MLLHLTESLRIYARRRVESEWSGYGLDEADLLPLTYSTAAERTDDAMALALYAVADVARQALTSTSTYGSSHIYQPRTLSDFSVLLATIVQNADSQDGSYNDKTMPCLPPPEAILLRWGSFLCWSWTVWTPHTSMYEVVNAIVCSFAYSFA